MRSLDTSSDADAIQLRLYRSLTDGQRLSLALKSSDAARKTALAALRRRHPDWAEPRIKREFLLSRFPADQLPPSFG